MAANDASGAPSPAGRYVVDFGGQTSSGLTAAEVAALLESERNAGIRIYRIHAAYPDGRMELVGVPAERFQLEDCFLFYRSTAGAARDDFSLLRRLGSESPPPCRAKLHLARLDGCEPGHVVALIYPAEYSDEMSAWLTGLGYEGGDIVEGGVSQVSGYYAAVRTRIEEHQFWGTEDGTLRAEERRRAALGA